jgi:nucleotide-binding universal stress UspA family protein
MAFTPQRLLCLVDFSPMSMAVLSWARLLAKCYRVQIEVFHAWWAPKLAAAEEAGQPALSFEVFGTEMEGRLNALAESAFGGNVKFHSRVVEGHPLRMVLQCIEQHPPDLIILGSHGYDGYARVMLGSVAESLLRTAPYPILIVKGAPLAGDVQSLHAIVCSVDLSDISRRCLLAASDLANILEADLHVAYVAAPGAQLEQARSALSSWIPDAAWSCSRVRDVVLQGEPAEKIVTYARNTQADLAVLAAEHHPFLEFTTLGRTTERVVRFCPCSVLVIPDVTAKPKLTVVAAGNT